VAIILGAVGFCFCFISGGIHLSTTHLLALDWILLAVFQGFGGAACVAAYGLARDRSWGRPLATTVLIFFLVLPPLFGTAIGGVALYGLYRRR